MSQVASFRCCIFSVSVSRFLTLHSALLKQLNHCPINLEALASRGSLKKVESVALPVGPTTSRLETGGEDEMRPQVL